MLSRIPMYPESLSRWKGNIHGHVHDNSLSDSRYINVSVENINYTPINFEEIRELFSSVTKLGYVGQEKEERHQ